MFSYNDNYMQDLYCYNQIPNNTYNPYGNMNMGNNMVGSFNNMSNYGSSNAVNIPNNNIMNGCMMNSMANSNQDIMQTNSNMWQTNSLYSMYPSIYRIINPVVNRVISNTNTQNLTDDNLNNMVDTVFNIVEGQVFSEMELESAINLDDTIRVNNTPTINSASTRSAQTDNRNSSTSSGLSTSSNLNNTSNTNTTNSNTSRNNNSMSNSRNSEEKLLKDLIKILIIKEILSRRQLQNQFNQNMQPMNSPYFNQMF